jgi:hypothetical protein
MYTPASRTLARAANALGGHRQLSEAFQVPAIQVMAWIADLEPTPAPVYVLAMDIVGRNPPLEG